MKLKFKKLHSDVKLPSYAHPGDAGMDIYSRELRTLEQGEPYIFKTGFATEFPEGHVALVKDKSGLGSKGLTVLGGVIDHGYRGEWGIILVNTKDHEYTVRPGDKIAQVLFMPVAQAEIEETEKLADHARADGGFGSTGR